MEIRICTAGNAIILSIRPAALSQSIMLLILSLTYNINYRHSRLYMYGCGIGNSLCYNASNFKSNIQHIVSEKREMKQ